MADDKQREEENRKRQLAEVQSRYTRAYDKVLGFRSLLGDITGKYGRNDTFSSVESFYEFRKLAWKKLDEIKESIEKMYASDGSLSNKEIR